MLSAVAVAAEERILLEGISWESYEALLSDWPSHRYRMTYDNGRLELMSPMHPHEQYGELIGRLVATFAEVLRIPIHSGRSTTFRRKAKLKGLEPDACWWIQNERPMRGKKDYEFGVDPPPDLCVEVDITSP